jgi:cysteinyl-tRNA synthetase
MNEVDIKMTIKIYNSLSKNKEEFIPIKDGKVKMYVCGMTVYSDAHIGHARTYFAFDMIRRYFEYKGYQVTYVQNITDVDDKIITAANKEGVNALEYSKKFTEICLSDLDDLGIRRADIYPKASETIPDMLEMIKKIIDRGYGYVSDGDVYFSVENMKDYGNLSGQKIEDLISGARVELEEKKRSPLDFALWKKAKKGEPFWESPWGNGRPGWHIECSTMSAKYLGLPFDIHGGGLDLRFPHHENEIAQAEAATGKKFAKYWMHIGLLTVNGEKMSKSIGNIINVKDLLKNWDPEIIRFFFAQAHYRSPPDFSEKALKNAKKGLIRIHRLKERLEEISNDVAIGFDKSLLSEEELRYLLSFDNFKSLFENAMNDDFNTPEAVALIFDFVNKSNSFLEKVSTPNKSLLKYVLINFVKLGKIITLFEQKKIGDDSLLIDKLQDILDKYDKKNVSRDLNKLMDYILDIRQNARKQKDWLTADDIRFSLHELGFEIQDTNDGPIWRKK